MSKRKYFRSLAAILALGLSMGLVACGGDDETAGKDGNKATADASSGKTDTDDDSDTGSGDGGSGEGKDGRAFDSGNEAVTKAMKAATKADDVKFDGPNVRVIFSEGSTEDLTAWIPCGALGVLLADDEKSFLVYPDGELDCAKRYEDD